jgi:hypothetical protein
MALALSDTLSKRFFATYPKNTPEKPKRQAFRQRRGKKNCAFRQDHGVR